MAARDGQPRPLRGTSSLLAVEATASRVLRPFVEARVCAFAVPTPVESVPVLQDGASGASLQNQDRALTPAVNRVRRERPTPWLSMRMPLFPEKLPRLTSPKKRPCGDSLSAAMVAIQRWASPIVTQRRPLVCGIRSISRWRAVKPTLWRPHAPRRAGSRSAIHRQVLVPAVVIEGRFFSRASSSTCGPPAPPEGCTNVQRRPRPPRRMRRTYMGLGRTSHEARPMRPKMSVPPACAAPPSVYRRPMSGRTISARMVLRVVDFCAARDHDAEGAVPPTGCRAPRWPNRRRGLGTRSRPRSANVRWR